MPWCGTGDMEFEVESCNLKFRVEDREAKEMFPPSMLGENKSRPAAVYYPPLVNGGMTPGGYDGAAYIIGRNGQEASGTSSGTIPYPFLSPPYDLVDGDQKFSIVGGELKISIRVGGQTVQTYTMEFPSADDLPLPILSETDVTAGHVWTSWGRPWWGRPRGASSSAVSGPLDNDVLHSMELASGDARLVAGWKDVPQGLFAAHADYGKPTRFAHGMRVVNHGWTVLWKGGTAGRYVDLPGFERAGFYDVAGRTGGKDTNLPKIPSGISSILDKTKGWSGDFDNGWAKFTNGPFINKPDEGMMHTSAGTSQTTNPYVNFRWSLADGLFSPLRQVPSAVMFGSLPTGVKANIPWQTLLFCPNPADPAHRGFQSPADHLLLDLFRMPVVEPQAISGPVSTDGKINMNYAIAPFSYIRRATSWYALLEPLKLFAVPDGQSAKYKGDPHSFDYRKAIDIEATLEQFESRFAADDIFRSATEICTLFLVPENETLASVSGRDQTTGFWTGFWSTHRLTGDNSREKPYAELYPKLTTQSNTLRIHMRVQVLRKSGGAPADGGDFQPLSEYRGSRLIERYLNPGNTRLESIDPDIANLNSLYQFRTLEAAQFQP